MLQRRTQGSNRAGVYLQCVARIGDRARRNLRLRSRLCSFQYDDRRLASSAHARRFVQLLRNLLRSHLLTSSMSASSLSSLQRVNSRSSHGLQPTKVGLSARFIWQQSENRADDEISRITIVRKCQPLLIAQTLAKEQKVKCKYCIRITLLVRRLEMTLPLSSYYQDNESDYCSRKRGQYARNPYGIALRRYKLPHRVLVVGCGRD